MITHFNCCSVLKLLTVYAITEPQTHTDRTTTPPPSHLLSLTVQVVRVGQTLDELQLRLEPVPGLLLWTRKHNKTT